MLDTLEATSSPVLFFFPMSETLIRFRLPVVRDAFPAGQMIGRALSGKIFRHQLRLILFLFQVRKEQAVFRIVDSTGQRFAGAALSASAADTGKDLRHHQEPDCSNDRRGSHTGDDLDDQPFSRSFLRSFRQSAGCVLPCAACSSRSAARSCGNVRAVQAAAALLAEELAAHIPVSAVRAEHRALELLSTWLHRRGLRTRRLRTCRGLCVCRRSHACRGLCVCRRSHTCRGLYSCRGLQRRSFLFFRGTSDDDRLHVVFIVIVIHFRI